MKRLSIVILVIMVMQSMVVAEDLGGKTRVAVLDFSAKGVETYLAEGVVENLITSLVDSGSFDVIERSQLKKLMSELSLQNSDDFNDELRQELGDLLGVELVILGSVTKMGSNITINARVVDVETGIAKIAKNLITNSENDIPYLIPLLVDIITGTKNGATSVTENETDIDTKSVYLEKERAKTTVTTGKKQLLCEYKAARKMSTKEFDAEKLADNTFSAIVIEVLDGKVEFIRVDISVKGRDVTESDNFFLGTGSDAYREFATVNKDGTPKRIKEVKLYFELARGEKGNARVFVYGVR